MGGQLGTEIAFGRAEPRGWASLPPSRSVDGALLSRDGTVGGGAFTAGESRSAACAELSESWMAVSQSGAADEPQVLLPRSQNR